ncbi:hypothetical protein GCM10023335_79270 [Streptomyces siamensis]|uniref:Uncharacterized protein n=1 Tax=Streptomyces siamensis TaxID=1274986 RepID=A0ABP9JM68_9ACTN
MPRAAATECPGPQRPSAPGRGDRMLRAADPKCSRPQARTHPAAGTVRSRHKWGPTPPTGPDAPARRPGVAGWSTRPASWAGRSPDGRDRMPPTASTSVVT